MSVSPTTMVTSATIIQFSPAESSIIPYTEGLRGVDLWLNSITSDALYASLGLLAILVFSARLVQVASSKIRLLATVNLDRGQQRYWTHCGSFWPGIKKHLLVAPLIHKRHNKEFQLSTAISVGTLPSRLHILFLSFYLLSNVLYCCLLDYDHQPRAALIAEARGRTGHLAVMNMLPLFGFSARNNPFSPLLGISFDTFNLFHRWIGRVVVLEALAHTFLWGVNNYDARGLEGLAYHLRTYPFLAYGLLSIASMTAILIQSISIIRHAFYESFLHLHQILIIAVVTGLILHCEVQSLPQRPFVYALITFWGVERFIRICKIYHRRGATVHVEALDGGACRVTFDIRGSWSKSPGRHIYAYIPSVSLWMSHPFSVAWVDPSPSSNCNCASVLSTQILHLSTSNDTERDFKPLPKIKHSRTEVSCIIASRTGMTASLYRKACESNSGIIRLRAFIEGPYGGLENSRTYGTVLLFAGGVGITHQISILADLVNAFSAGTCATRKVVLVWSVREVEQLGWASGWIKDLIHRPRRGCELKILLFVTRTPLPDRGYEAASKEMGLNDHTAFGRVNIREMVNKEFNERVGAMSIGVCGPGGLADDVRAASRAVMDLGNVDFWEESFTW